LAVRRHEEPQTADHQEDGVAGIVISTLSNRVHSITCTTDNKVGAGELPMRGAQNGLRFRLGETILERAGCYKGSLSNRDSDDFANELELRFRPLVEICGAVVIFWAAPYY
jgi:hypothetical protein